jgi:serine/threonine-protein kinase HipA
LPEGLLLEGLLKQRKIDKFDYLSQLIAVGNDLVGAVTVQEKNLNIKETNEPMPNYI